MRTKECQLWLHSFPRIDRSPFYTTTILPQIQRTKQKRLFWAVWGLGGGNLAGGGWMDFSLWAKKPVSSENTENSASTR